MVRPLVCCLVLACVLPGVARGHGGVAFEEDQCVININFMQAHFTVFQPESRGNEEFCEAIPEVARSVFVMEYLHQRLSEMAVDFRIVRDVNNVGRFASWDDVQAIDDLEAATVFYQAPTIEDGGFSVLAPQSGRADRHGAGDLDGGGGAVRVGHLRARAVYLRAAGMRSPPDTGQ